MKLFAERLLRAETQADKEEFVRGVANLNKEAGEKKILAGVIAGTLLAALGRKK